VNPYRLRVWDAFQPLLARVGRAETALDFGSGDGWFATRVRASGRVGDLTPVDVLRRDAVLVEPVLYDGTRLPFPDRAFDLSYAVDVLHHCPDPAATLRDLLRVTARWLLLKDHTYTTPAGRLALAVLDELGNRRFGVPSVYKYQHAWDWFPVVEAAGFRLVERVHPVRCHVRLLGAVTNRFQFAALWERTGG
jgi:SAM-dependent methyltransferase